MFERLTDLAARVPFWDLRRPMTIEALDDTVERIVETVRGG
jgi:hypothetical protein